jgi:hypothetical protein
MSSTLPADEHKSEAKIPSTPIVKLADFLKEESVTDGSTLELVSNPTKERAYGIIGLIAQGSRGVMDMVMEACMEVGGL